VDGATGRPYFARATTGAVTWERPGTEGAAAVAAEGGGGGVGCVPVGEAGVIAAEGVFL